jgi:hypothetical protein
VGGKLGSRQRWSCRKHSCQWFERSSREGNRVDILDAVLSSRLELAIKDAFHGACFTLIDEMFLRLYYLYEKSPKKCRNLESIVIENSLSITRELSQLGCAISLVP